jgi:VanZ family protein
VTNFSIILVSLAALGVFGVGWWLTGPVSLIWRWVIRGALGGVLLALLTPASLIDAVQDWLKTWLPLAASASQASGADWVVHFCSFAGISALLFFFRQDVPRSALLAGLIGLGGLTEMLQYLVEGRTASLGDLVADSAGVVLGYGIAQIFGGRLRREGIDAG